MTFMRAGLFFVTEKRFNGYKKYMCMYVCVCICMYIYVCVYIR